MVHTGCIKSNVFPCHIEQTRLEDISLTLRPMILISNVIILTEDFRNFSQSHSQKLVPFLSFLIHNYVEILLAIPVGVTTVTLADICDNAVPSAMAF
jgi:hypothetical protein